MVTENGDNDDDDGAEGGGDADTDVDKEATRATTTTTTMVISGIQHLTTRANQKSICIAPMLDAPKVQLRL